MIVKDQKCLAVFDIVNNQSTYEMLSELMLSPEKFSIENVNFPMCVVGDSLIASYVDLDFYDVIKDHFSINPEIDTHLSNGGVIICLNHIK